MDKINRRKFIKTGVTGLAGLTVAGSGLLNASCTSAGVSVDKVKLGKSGLQVSRIAMGTGTVGGNKASNQTRQGMESFTNMARHAYERGIRFFDMADGYGSHPYVGEAIKTLPREKVTLLTKMWTHENGSEHVRPVGETLDKYRQEIGVDYIDILLMHCLMQGDWDKTRTHYIDGLSKAKQDGIVKAVGVSCHNIDALRTAATHPWVDVIMARINPFGTKMDGSPDEVKEILALAQQNGKGVIGMKIFGEGDHITDPEREKSIKFALTEGNVNSLTLGMESIAQIDDAVERVMRLAKG
ncbi:aryl-alcohol dehydrogenase-like predicted oxidoreductase [Parabacteroides sp. PF5-5]|uniref:aldo/keto reductase n=1 Tax=unclassified Parabacteroides TaxID=2649774 RepID=UPI002473A009|nr:MULTISPECIES: aldo/keto reductase [unclassified Parabacteroides]MDH6306459.1 aryl-alcohol dehydrogenase-like predicted oxidoreductase [Parabacteroides sp. PH5-39]MDH6317389.1 aryl-alcohol dehydrogenase-like predicted oxidoreductase [Parabacteroides sp. PF5-13]MDH6321170.1 aryl-alcohol dehydrogenase-like predicted oxidoreductase [Parabacteroides sp. PH5-13]MDH6324902.1 aryl-alcohol dehydrogenase-like predicted oxidoreductase [Parabacteroides sp. PH5-8]MDH6328574.1 aryl-alcohol dehydrogenase-